MKIFDRVLLTIYTLIILAVSIGILFFSFGYITIEDAVQYLKGIEYGIEFIAITAVIALLFLVVSLKLLFSGASKPKTRSALVKFTQLGVIRASLTTLESFTLKSARSFSEIKDVKCSILVESEGIRIVLTVMLMPDVKIPELTQKLQEEVKRYVESYSGIIVKEVQIYIDNLFTPPVSRVE